MSLPKLEKLIAVVKKLRDPEGGCPWDLEQDHQSLTPYLIEETYELIHAITEKDNKNMEEELGDVLLQVILHSQIGSEGNNFDIESVAGKIAEKMIRRHPHVFDENVTNAGESGEKKSIKQIKQTWDEIKKLEKKKKLAQHPDQEKADEIFDKSYLNFPALFASHKIGHKTKKFNFDWDEVQQVLYKVEEEWQELKVELAPKGKYNIENVTEELGDFLFSTAQLARHLNLNAEEVLAQANKKFIRRFNHMNKLLLGEGLQMENVESSELENYWSQVKQIEKESKN